MKLTLLLVVLAVAVAVVASEKQKKKGKALLNGKPDLQMNVMQKLPPPAQAPKNIREMKKLAKLDRKKMRELHDKVRVTKKKISDEKTPKSVKKRLKKELKGLKKNLHEKKREVQKLKRAMRAKKTQKLLAKQAKKAKDKQGKSKGIKSQSAKNHFNMLGESDKKPNIMTVTGKPKVFTAAPTTAVPLLLNNKASRRKSQRKNNRKGKKNKNKSKDLLSRLQADAPAVLPPVQTRGHVVRPKCKTDADCPAKTRCVPNKKGHKHCKGKHGTDKAAGKKCHSSEQCARGLQCFVTKTPEMLKHKKHPRRGKGICADPKTTDASKGKFIPFRSTLTQT